MGSKGDHLVLKDDINVAPPVVGVTNSDVNRPYIKIDPALRSLSQVQSRGWSIYHSLQSKFTKRFSYGLTFVNSYTWGKNLDIVSDTEGATLNPYNFNYDRAVSDYDITHNFTSAVNYELPFGRGKKFGGGANGFVDKVVGGWHLNALFLTRTGLPFTVTQQQGLLSNGTGNRPNRISSGTVANPTPDRWWDTCTLNSAGVRVNCASADEPIGFQATADNTGTYGSSGRNILRGPGQTNVDFSMIKDTRIFERFQHQLRVEMFNALNHPQFANPGNQLGSSSQGVISSLLFGTPMRQIQIAMKLTF